MVSLSKFSLGQVLSYLAIFTIWCLVARFTIGFLGGLFYFPWLFLGIGCLIWLFLNHFFYNFRLIEKFGAVVLGVALIGPIFGSWSLNAFWQYDEAKTIQALDQFINEVVHTGGSSSDFQLNGEYFREDFSSDYRVTDIDYLLGEYDIGVRFANGVVYDFQISHQGGPWNIFVRKRD